VRRSGYLVLITVVLGLLSGAADSLCQQQHSERNSLPTLTKAHDAHSLTSEQAARSYPVHLRTVVTYYDPYIDPHYPTVWVSDSSGGIYVVLSAVPAVPFKAGDLVEITGTSAAGGYAPVVKDGEARVIGKSPLPSPASITLGQMLTGAEDGRWVEVEGVVHAVRESGKNINLDLALSDGTVLATTVKEVGADYDSLVDAKVRLRGNQAPLFNHQGAMTGSYLVFPDRAQVMVMEPSPAHPFMLPISPVSGLLRFNPKPAWDHRVHIRGTVTLAWPGRLLCLQDGPQGLCAQTDQTTPLNPGEQADVIGFPIIGAFTPTLISATYEAAGFQRSARPVAVTADQALRGDHDAELVELEGQLVGQDETAGHPNIVLSSQNQVFSAVLPATIRNAATRLAKGNHTQSCRNLLDEGRPRQGRYSLGWLFSPRVVPNPAALATGCGRDQESTLVDSKSCNQRTWFGGCAHPGSPCLGVRAAQARRRANPYHPAATSGSGQTRVRDSNTE
jgi:hypothetical protein